MRRVLLCLALAISACAAPSDPAATPTAATNETAPSQPEVDTPTPRPARAEAVDVSHSYGSDSHQYGELMIPAVDGELPVVVLIHGGFWSNRYGLDLMEPLVEDLNERGFATWNIEYRRIGDDGGGYPNTLSDIAAAIHALTDVPGADRLDLDRVAVIGHSSGGHLALWGAGEDLDPVVPALTIGLAPVVDLIAAADNNLGGGAVRRLLGGSPDEIAEIYEAARPALENAAGTVLILHGEQDFIVPPSQAESVPAEDAKVVIVPATDHFDVIDPTHRAWGLVVEALLEM